MESPIKRGAKIPQSPRRVLTMDRSSSPPLESDMIDQTDIYQAQIKKSYMWPVILGIISIASISSVFFIKDNTLRIILVVATILSLIGAAWILLSDM